MIELAIKTALERITGMNTWPLLLPDEEQEGITYQLISDPEIEVGMVRTGLIAARFQITIYLMDDYPALLRLDKKIWREWKSVVHGRIGGVPVQYVARGGIQQDKHVLTSGRVQYRLARDFIITCAQTEEDDANIG